MWAHVAAGVITAWGDLPSFWDGSRQWDLRPRQHRPSWVGGVTPTDRPADTATTTTVETIEPVDGIPTRCGFCATSHPRRSRPPTRPPSRSRLPRAWSPTRLRRGCYHRPRDPPTPTPTTAWSGRSVLAGTDPAGLTPLRAWRSRPTPTSSRPPAQAWRTCSSSSCNWDIAQARGEIRRPHGRCSG